MPISREKLAKAHTRWREQAVTETFRKTSVFEDTQKYATKLEVTQNMLANIPEYVIFTFVFNK